MPEIYSYVDQSGEQRENKRSLHMTRLARIALASLAIGGAAEHIPTNALAEKPAVVRILHTDKDGFDDDTTTPVTNAPSQLAIALAYRGDRITITHFSTSGRYVYGYIEHKDMSIPPTCGWVVRAVLPKKIRKARQMTVCHEYFGELKDNEDITAGHINCDRERDNHACYDGKYVRFTKRCQKIAYAKYTPPMVSFLNPFWQKGKESGFFRPRPIRAKGAFVRYFSHDQKAVWVRIPHTKKDKKKHAKGWSVVPAHCIPGKPVGGPKVDKDTRPGAHPNGGVTEDAKLSSVL